MRIFLALILLIWKVSFALGQGLCENTEFESAIKNLEEHSEIKISVSKLTKIIHEFIEPLLARCANDSIKSNFGKSYGNLRENANGLRIDTIYTCQYGSKIEVRLSVPDKNKFGYRLDLKSKNALFHIVDGKIIKISSYKEPFESFSRWPDELTMYYSSWPIPKVNLLYNDWELANTTVLVDTLSEFIDGNGYIVERITIVDEQKVAEPFFRYQYGLNGWHTGKRVELKFPNDTLYFSDHFRSDRVRAIYNKDLDNSVRLIYYVPNASSHCNAHMEFFFNNNGDLDSLLCGNGYQRKRVKLKKIGLMPKNANDLGVQELIAYYNILGTAPCFCKKKTQRKIYPNLFD